MHLRISKIFSAIFTAALLLSGSSAISIAGEHTSHCLANENVYFSCLMSNGKTLSLCGTTKALSYRYGRPDNLELVFPNNAADSIKLFSYNNYSSYDTDYYRVNFSNESYHYSIYRDIDNELTPRIKAGITVERTSPIGKKEFNFTCTANISESLYELSDLLACNRESALGCAD